MEKITDPIVIDETNSLLRDSFENLRDDIDDIVDDHKLFLYFIGQQFENIPPDKLTICDRAGDQKIDFYRAREDTFVAYQCKMPDLDSLPNGKIKHYGADEVNEIEDILSFLTDDEGSSTGNTCSQAARNRYRMKRNTAKEDNSNYPIEVNLAIYGKLTKPGKDRLEELKRT